MGKNLPESNSKYQRWYNQIIDRARLRVDLKYGEKHHVVPRSLGGSNAKSNIVKLTYREHFLVHWLLTKFTTKDSKYKMLCALHRMTYRRGGQRIIAGWQYALARKAISVAMTGQKPSPKVLAIFRRPKTEEHKRKLSEAKLASGFKPCLSAESIAKQAASLKKWHANNPMPEERRESVRARSLGNQYAKGYSHTAEECAARRRRMLGNTMWKGKKLSRKHRANCSKARRAYLATNPDLTHTAETRAKMRASRLAYLARTKREGLS